MADKSNNWIRVSRDSPCPVCEKPDNCSVSRDGKMVWCGRVSANSIEQNRGGQFLHRLNDAIAFPPPPRPTKTKRNPRRDWPALADRLYSQGRQPREQLSRELGVSVRSLERLHVGWDPNSEYWSVPERNATGKVIGINARYRQGAKIRLTGSKAGLTYAPHWSTGNHPLLLPEGASDTAAALTIGLDAVGRPSNTGGVALLVELLREFPLDREIIVMAERDRKSDGRWPGRDGALSTATQLAEQLQRTICWSLPPDYEKDMRGWLNSMPNLPPDRLADLFLTGLLRNRIDPPITIRTSPKTGPAREIGDWRNEMLQSRIRSIDVPGYYLDASTTGSGKTYADIHALVHARGMDR